MHFVFPFPLKLPFLLIKALSIYFYLCNGMPFSNYALINIKSFKTRLPSFPVVCICVFLLFNLFCHNARVSLPSSSLLSTEHLNPTKVSLQLSCEAKAFISGLLFDFNSSFTFTSKPGLPLVAWCVNCSNDCFIESPQDSRQEEKEDQSQPVVEMASGTDLLLHRLLPLLTDILCLTALLCFNLCGCLCALHPNASHFLQRFFF